MPRTPNFCQARTVASELESHKRGLWELSIQLQASALNDTHQDHDDGDDQQSMQESTHGVGGNQADQPENNQDYCNGFENFRYSL